MLKNLIVTMNHHGWLNINDISLKHSEIRHYKYSRILIHHHQSCKIRVMLIKYKNIIDLSKTCIVGF